jgi:hypothetical protein
MTPQCQMVFGNKFWPAVHKKGIAVGIIGILAEFNIHLQMYHSLASLSPQSVRSGHLPVKQKFNFPAGLNSESNKVTSQSVTGIVYASVQRILGLLLVRAKGFILYHT